VSESIADSICDICGRADAPDELMICDKCKHHAAHAFRCLQLPALPEVKINAQCFVLILARYV
jgi:hypothetical protein